MAAVLISESYVADVADSDWADSGASPNSRRIYVFNVMLMVYNLVERKHKEMRAFLKT